MDEMNETIKPSEQEKENCGPKVWRVVKKTLKVLGIVFSVLLVVVIGVSVYLWHYLYEFNNSLYGQSKFNKEIWLEAEKKYNPAPGEYHHDYTCVRGKMYRDLQKNYLKKEMTLEEIEQLLGKTSIRKLYRDDGKRITPEEIKQLLEKKTVQRVDQDNGKMIECPQYHLGSCSRIGGPPAMLVFCPNKNGKFVYSLTNSNDGGISLSDNELRGR